MFFLGTPSTGPKTIFNKLHDFETCSILITTNNQHPPLLFPSTLLNLPSVRQGHPCTFHLSPPIYSFFSVKRSLLKVFDEKKEGEHPPKDFKRLLNLALKGSIILLLSLSIYWKIGSSDHPVDLWKAFVAALQTAQWGFFVLVVLLMPVNWMLEAVKWWQFIPGRMRFWQVLKATLSGVTVALFTPNRIGDYGGRVLLVQAKDNWATLVATMAGNYCQLVVLISGGVIGLSYFGRHYLTEDWQALRNLIPLAIVFLLGLWSLPLTFKYLDPYLKRLEKYNWLRPLARNLRGLEEVSKKALLKSFAFAMARYSVYSFQYFFILHFYGVEVGLWDGLAGISTIFFIQASVPLPPVSALLARGQIAMLIWTPFGANSIGILAATFTLFIINLVIPAFFGLIYIIKTNTIKSLGYENHAN
jgi:hypothetical protein